MLNVIIGIQLTLGWLLYHSSCIHTIRLVRWLTALLVGSTLMHLELSYLKELGLLMTPYFYLIAAVSGASEWMESSLFKLRFISYGTLLPIVFVVMVPSLGVYVAGFYYAAGFAVLLAAIASKGPSNTRYINKALAAVMLPAGTAWFLGYHLQVVGFELPIMITELLSILVALILLRAPRHKHSTKLPQLLSFTCSECTSRTVDDESFLMADMERHHLKNKLINMKILSERFHSSLASPTPEPGQILKYTEKLTSEIEAALALMRKQNKTSIKGSASMAIAEVSLTQLLDNVMEPLKMIWEPHGIQIHRYYSSKLPAIVGDQVALQETFSNLLINACEAMEPQGNGKLEVTIYREPLSIVVEIKDTGPGIEQQELDRIFMPYYSTKQRDSNYGLGLAYCKQVITGHGGTIKVASNRGEGTVMTVRLPLVGERSRQSQIWERGMKRAADQSIHL